MMMMMMLVVMLMAADFIIAYGAKLEACTQILEMPEWKGRTENARRERKRTTTRQKLQNVMASCDPFYCSYLVVWGLWFMMRVRIRYLRLFFTEDGSLFVVYVITEDG